MAYAMKRCTLLCPMDSITVSAGAKCLSANIQTVLRCLMQIYGMKAAAREFYNVFSAHLRSATTGCNFFQLPSDGCVFVKCVKDGVNVVLSDLKDLAAGNYDQVMIICLWVDDLMCCFSHQSMLDELLESFKGKFSYRDEGIWSYLLGMNLTISDSNADGSYEIRLSHESYFRKFLDSHKAHFKQHPIKTPTKSSNHGLSRDDCPKSEFEIKGMKDKYSVYRSVLGGLVHIMNWTHPELAYSVSVASMFMSNPGVTHFAFLMLVLQYCIGVQDKALVFRPWGQKLAEWIGYSDSDYASDESRRSRTGYCWFFCGNLISWCSKLQHSVTLSTAESEYQALCSAAQEMIWLTRLSAEMGFPSATTTTLYSDNKACIAIAHNPVQHKYTKHIDIKLHFIRELIERKVVNVVYIETAANVADIFTKGLSTKLFFKHRDSLFGLRAVGPLSLEAYQITGNLRDHIELECDELISTEVKGLSCLFQELMG